MKADDFYTEPDWKTLAKEHHDKLYGGKTLEEATSPEMLDGQAASVVPLDNDVEFSDSNVPPEDPKVEKTDIDVQGDFPEKDNIVTRGNRDKKEFGEGCWERCERKLRESYANERYKEKYCGPLV